MRERENSEIQAGEDRKLSLSSQTTSQFDTDSETDTDGGLRFLLSYLYGTEHEIISVEELVAAFVEQEFARPKRTDDRPVRQSVRTSLLHEYLPRLESVAVIDRDPRRGQIRILR